MTHRRTDDAVRNPLSEFDGARPKRAQPDLHIYWTGVGQAVGVQHARRSPVDDHGLTGQ